MNTLNTTPPAPVDLSALTIAGLAHICRRDWKNVNFAARPYLEAMNTLADISENYGADTGREIVMYFLSNATSWRGETAKVIKAELKRRLSGKAAKTKVRRAYTIAPDGTETTVEPANGTDFTLDELRAAIGGGFVEMAETRDGRCLFMDEDGRRKNLPHNQKATDLYLQDSICGTVLVCRRELVK